MPLVNPVKLLLKDPVPVPLEVFESAIVGAPEVFQQIPLALTGSPPSSVILPPLIAVVDVMLFIAVVVTVGPNDANTASKHIVINNPPPPPLCENVIVEKLLVECTFNRAP